MINIKRFMEQNFKHFNARVLVSAAKEYKNQLDMGNKMMITLAGAMSSAELGITLAQMIREDKVHAICSTGANIEEDIFNLTAHNHYEVIENWRLLTPKDDEDLLNKGLNRVTDTCIPETEAMRVIEKHMKDLWKKADQENKSYFPYEYFYMLLDEKLSDKDFHIPKENSWVYAAKEKNLPIFTPGYEDSTLANMFVAALKRGDVKSSRVIKDGFLQMSYLIDWYLEKTKDNGVGFFQIGGGIAGDFPICVVPLIEQDLEKDVKKWSYFCQISDSTTSFGSYSGATPNEKISWGKLETKTPGFIIESDASIVAPLFFAYVLS